MPPSKYEALEPRNWHKNARPQWRLTLWVLVYGQNQTIQVQSNNNPDNEHFFLTQMVHVSGLCLSRACPKIRGIFLHIRLKSSVWKFWPELLHVAHLFLVLSQLWTGGSTFSIPDNPSVDVHKIKIYMHIHLHTCAHIVYKVRNISTYVYFYVYIQMLKPLLRK